jgi:fibronectin type 3 domain-containing protein
VASAGDAQVTLTWEAIDGALSYNVYVSETAGETANAEPVSAVSSPYVHTSLSNGMTYYFTVSAVTEAGEGDLSAEVSATPRISAPEGVSAQGGVAEVTLTWDPVSGADTYNVYWTDEPGVTLGANRVSGETSPFVHTQRDSGTTYYYVVTAVDGPSESVLSEEASATTASLPEAPGYLVASAGDAQVTLTWEAIDGALSYNVYVSETAGETANAEPVSAVSSPYVHTSLSNGMTYYFAVAAVVEAREGNLSAEVSATPCISAPEGVSAQGGDEQVTLSWDPVPGAERYYVYWADEPGVTLGSARVSAMTSPYVHKPLFNNTTYYYALTAVDGPSESVLSDEVSASTLIDEGAKLVATDPQESDAFGFSVALSGDYAIVGAYGENGGDGDPMPSAGAAYVFKRTGNNTWDTGTKLVALDAQEGDNFGISVALSGDYAIVGSFWEDGGDGDPMTNAGAAYVFKRTGDNTWDTGTKLVAPYPQAGDEFGISVALSGDYAIVGARQEDGGGGDPMTNAGAAYVFKRTDDSWDAGTKLVAPDTQARDQFGVSVALSGDYAIVGAYYEDGGDGNPLAYAGAAYVFKRTGDNTWDTGTKLVAHDAQAGDEFGGSVALNGDYAIVGAFEEDGGDGDPMTNAGAAYVFKRTGDNTWDTGTKLVAHDAQAGDSFGTSVALSGNYAIVGANRENGGDGNPMRSAGAAYVFKRTGDTWDTGTKLVATDPQEYDYFGMSVALSADCAIVGAYAEDGGDGDPISFAGAAYIYVH